ncbi:MAG: decaprenyl-phosphate phosphoribosyltransferase [bacterium]
MPEKNLHQTPQRARLRDWIMALRPRQWIKNLVVLAALLFTGFNHPAGMLLAMAVAVAVTCVISSLGYLINDLLDIEKDRQHPVKKHRPIASGRLQPHVVVIYAVVLAVIGLGGAYLISTKFLLVALAYMVITITYSTMWKHQVILDLICIAAGFVLRAYAGTVVLGVTLSPWMFVCVLLLALLLGLGKRRHELCLLKDGAKSHRPVLDDYNRAFIDQALAMMSSASVVTYAIYAINSPAAHDHPMLVLTVPVVIYGVLRYLYLIFYCDKGGQPEELFYTDKPLYLTVAIWTATVIAAFIWH